MNKVSDMYHGPMESATSFFVWFDPLINQENQFQSVPPSFYGIAPMKAYFRPSLGELKYVSK